MRRSSNNKKKGGGTKKITVGNNASDWLQFALIILFIFILLSFAVWCSNNQEKCTSLFFNKEGNFNPNLDNMSMNPDDYKIGNSHLIEPKGNWDKFKDGVSQATNEVKQGWNEVKKDFK